MSQNNNSGIGFFGWLTLIFIVLKLTNVISWSWVWVLSPTWIPLGIVIVIFALIGLFALIRKGIKGKQKQ